MTASTELPAGERTRIARTILDQIGVGTVAAISGLRHGPILDGRPGVDLPAGQGYHVLVVYDVGRDLYDVHRVFRRRGVNHDHGVARGVFAHQLSEVAYRASCHAHGDEFAPFT